MLLLDARRDKTTIKVVYRLTGKYLIYSFFVLYFAPSFQSYSPFQYVLSINLKF